MERIIKEIILTDKQIAKKVKEIAKKISADYKGKEITLVAVLKGATLFLSDLCRYIDVPVTIDFIAVSSYGSSTETSGVVRILKDLDEPVESRNIIVVEDIIDTGLTLNYLVTNLKRRNVASLKVCALLDRPHKRKVDVKVDYSGFIISDDYVVGYGLDYKQKYRNIPFIFSIKPEFL